MEQNAHGRRPHYHRGRRGQDRRGSDRRPAAAPQPPQDAAVRDSREHVDIEQIMREIRSRISKGSGLDLSNQQIQELAARRLEAVLDPRTIKPGLLDQLRRGATVADLPPAAKPASIEVSEASLAASFFQRVFKPLTVLLAPILQAFKAQDALNREFVEREAAANRRQAEWNALQFELLQKMVTETSRVSIEMQSLSLRIESLAAKVDFNERRVRAMETAPPPRPSGRHEQREPRESREPREPRESRELREPRPEPREPVAASTPPSGTPADPTAVSTGGQSQPEQVSADGTRRRRRRRRGRRNGAGQPGSGFATVAGEQPAPDESDVESAEMDGDLDSSEPTDDESPLMGVAADQPAEAPVSASSEIAEVIDQALTADSSAAWTPAPADQVAAPPALAEQPMPPRDTEGPSAGEAPLPHQPTEPGPPDR